MPKKMMSTRRRMTIATWRPPHEGVIHGIITLDATNVLEYLDRAREATGEKVTITSFIGAAVGKALALEPTLNGFIAWGNYYNYDDVSVSFLVQVDGGKQLAQVLVKDIDKMSPAQVARSLQDGAGHIRSGKDENFKKSAGIASKVPTWALRRIFSLAGFMTVAVGKPFGGQPPYPFGSAIITSVGMLGVDEALVPHTPFTRVPLLVAVGAIQDMVFAIDGKPEVRKGLTITATLDHRFVDGFQAATVARAFKDFFANPDQLGPLDDVRQAPGAPAVEDDVDVAAKQKLAAAAKQDTKKVLTEEDPAPAADGTGAQAS